MKPTSTEAAICCMIVSNPSGGMQPHGWQKRVNDLIRAQDQELTTLRAEADRSHAQAERAALLLTDAVNQLATLRASEAAAVARVKVLEAALKPFANAADARKRKGIMGGVCFVQSHLLAARQALTPTADKEPKT